MELILKQYDIPLLRFSATNDSSTPEIEVHWINEDAFVVLVGTILVNPV